MIFLDQVVQLLEWCKLKLLLLDKQSKVAFKEGEIWWCKIGMNVGVEIYGKGVFFSRPIVVLRKLNKDFFIGVPLTSKLKEGNWFAPVIYGGKEGRAVLSQVRALDSKRLISRIGVLSDIHFSHIKKAFHDLLCE